MNPFYREEKLNSWPDSGIFLCNYDLEMPASVEYSTGSQKENYFSLQPELGDKVIDTHDETPNSIDLERGYYHKFFDIDNNECNLEAKVSAPVPNLSKLLKQKSEIDALSMLGSTDEVKDDPQPVEEVKTGKVSECNISETLDDLFSSKKCPKAYKSDLSTRKDVVYKNVLRVVSRYYKELLARHFPHFKNAFKSAQNLDNLLKDF